MAKSQDSYNKKEKEKKRLKKVKEKLERREQRKVEKEEAGPKSFEDMISYVDEDGNLTSTPPDPTKKKKVIKAEDIMLGVPPRDNTPMETTRNGIVKFFNGEKGYGFIIDVETNESVFVHMNNLSDPVTENDKVTFEVEMGPKGMNAVNVKLIKA
ncbi:MAG: cold shock CspA family protein [Saprospiraceae bacterium]|jgi:cold shock CspA family protein